MSACCQLEARCEERHQTKRRSQVSMEIKAHHSCWGGVHSAGSHPGAAKGTLSWHVVSARITQEACDLGGFNKLVSHGRRPTVTWQYQT